MCVCMCVCVYLCICVLNQMNNVDADENGVY